MHLFSISIFIFDFISLYGGKVTQKLTAIEPNVFINMHVSIESYIGNYSTIRLSG